jgi:hypothetical protein
LKFASKHSPALYKPHVGELVKAIADEDNTRLVEVCLQALAALARWDDSLAPIDRSVQGFSSCSLLMLPHIIFSDRRTTERVKQYALNSNFRHAKFAARLLAFFKDRKETCVQVVEVGYILYIIQFFSILVPSPLPMASRMLLPSCWLLIFRYWLNLRDLLPMLSNIIVMSSRPSYSNEFSWCQVHHIW